MNSTLVSAGTANDTLRLKEILDRYRAVSEEQDRADAQARRVAEEEALRKARLVQAWAFLQPKRQQVLEEINAALCDTGFQLQIFGESSGNDDGELESFKVKFAGRPHPQLSYVFLRVSLRENGSVFVDVTGAKHLERKRSLSLQEFTIGAWQDIILDHLAAAAPREETAARADDTANPGS